MLLVSTKTFKTVSGSLPVTSAENSRHFGFHFSLRVIADNCAI